jgi:heptosyltransferase-3
VARLLKEKFPNCQIDLLVYEGTEPLLRNNGDFRHIWSWKRGIRGWKGLWNYLALFFQLRQKRYDWVLHLSDQMQGALIAKLCAGQGAVGIDYPRRRNIIWRSCFTHLIPLFETNTRHTVEQHLALLAPLGIEFLEEPPSCRLEITDADRRFIEKLLRHHGVVGSYLVVHPAARWFFKCWEEDRFAEVIHYFAHRGWSIVLTASSEPEEIGMVTTILEKGEHSSIISLAGQLTLEQLAALIEGARLFLGVDSVPMHMAAALKKDTVALFGATKVNEWHPWQTRYRLVDAHDYGTVIDADAVNTATRERYLKNIPVAAVIAAVEELLAV